MLEDLPMHTPWMILLEIIPVLAMVLMVISIPLLSDGPPRCGGCAKNQP